MKMIRVFAAPELAFAQSSSSSGGRQASTSLSEELQHGGRIGCEDPADARVAHIRIFRDGQGPSRLVLPLAVRVPPAAAH
jgi:hypothetical protein